MRLKEIRKAQKISVPKLSEMTGLHYRTIQDIEKRGDCLVSNAKIFAKALGVTLDELCADEEQEG
ncbi:MAG: helix-turn-helix domain-containing protein [Ruminococcus sp.]|nr:helix-turn-helix domain-containing protein [Ruminococcus sp.]